MKKLYFLVPIFLLVATIIYYNSLPVIVNKNYRQEYRIQNCEIFKSSQQTLDCIERGYLKFYTGEVKKVLLPFAENGDNLAQYLLISEFIGAKHETGVPASNLISQEQFDRFRQNCSKQQYSDCI